MKFAIIGNGESRHNYPQDRLSIGLTYCDILTDYLFVCDPPDVFDEEKQNRILQNTALFFSPYDWPRKQEFVELEKCFYQWNDPKLPRSISSVVPAIGLAVKLGATEIELFGCDFETHHLSHRKELIPHYEWMLSECKKRGVHVFTRYGLFKNY